HAPSLELTLPPAAPGPAPSLIHAAEPEPVAPAVMAMASASRESSSLPFDEDATVRAPRPARPPLGVRRATPESPRGRPRPNRPVRFDSSSDLILEAPIPEAEVEPEPTPVAVPTPATTSMEPASLAVRLGALAIDTALLGAVSFAVLFLTLRIAGLSLVWADIRVLPPIPFISFLTLLSLGYVASFTVAGGQTIGKMLTGARVIGDDGRPVDVAGGVLRALGCALVPLTIGLSYSPVVLSIERRALHDRLAGTRVVRA
ncbi:MAG: RDD family protein, partial [Vicinamibacterales bacterium]